MKIECPSCHFTGSISDDKVSDAGITVSCPKCKEKFQVSKPIGQEPAPTPEIKACRFCGEEILAVAIKCKHCGSMLDVESESSVHVPVQEKLQSIEVNSEMNEEYPPKPDTLLSGIKLNNIEKVIGFLMGIGVIGRIVDGKILQITPFILILCIWLFYKLRNKTANYTINKKTVILKSKSNTKINTNVKGSYRNVFIFSSVVVIMSVVFFKTFELLSASTQTTKTEQKARTDNKKLQEEINKGMAESVQKLKDLIAESPGGTTGSSVPSMKSMSIAGITERKYYGACQDEVKPGLKAPSTAKFASFSDIKDRIILNDDKTILYFYVDAQNGYGAMIRTSCKCMVENSTGRVTLSMCD